MKPILFNTEMVTAILEGRKTVTRRVIKDIPENLGNGDIGVLKRDDGTITGYGFENLLYQVGDILYVRETWCRADDGYYYKAGFKDTEGLMKAYGYKWHPSIHMPKEIARIFLKVTDVRVERVKNITWEQTLAEGIEHDNVNKQEDILCEYCPIEESQRGVKNYGNGPSFCIDSGMCEKAKLNFEDDCVDCFSELWDSTIKKQDLDKYSWEANPWVWVIEFEKIEREEK